MDNTDAVETLTTHQSFDWIQTDSDAYICPRGAIENKEAATDAELEKLCVRASDNPQND